MPAPVHLITALIRISFIFWFSFLPFYGILLFLFTAGHSYPMLLSCRFFPVYVAMLQYNRICDVTTRYCSGAVNSHPSAMLAEIQIFVFTFCLLQLGFFYFAFIPSEVFFRQVAFVGIDRSTSRCGNSAGECVATTGEELTVMQCQFLLNRVSPVG